MPATPPPTPQVGCLPLLSSALTDGLIHPLKKSLEDGSLGLSTGRLAETLEMLHFYSELLYWRLTVPYRSPALHSLDFCIPAGCGTSTWPKREATGLGARHPMRW